MTSFFHWSICCLLLMINGNCSNRWSGEGSDTQPVPGANLPVAPRILTNIYRGLRRRLSHYQGVRVPMGSMETTYDQSKDLTTVKVVGKVSEDDFWRWVGNFYSGAVTSLVLWDLVQSDLSDIVPAITDEDIREHVRQVNEAAAKLRKGGKTAFVVSDNVQAFRLSIRLESLANTFSSPFARKTFTSIDEATKWLGI